MSGHDPGVHEAGEADGKPEEVCGWTEGSTGVPLGRLAGSPAGGENTSHHTLLHRKTKKESALANTDKANSESYNCKNCAR